MQRRLFIRLSAYTAAALTVPLVSGCHQKMDIASQPQFFSHLVDAKTIKEIGQAYLKTKQEEDGSDKLKALLLGDSTQSIPPDNTAISTMLAANVKKDFKAGNIAVIKGWVLSVTEARQCALFSILQS
jgi:hypothetical protein